MKGLILLAAGLAACGGASAERPLSVSTGLDHGQLVAALRDHEYCQREDLGAKGVEVFPRCDAPGAEFGQSWVVAHYDESGKTVKVERWERYADEARTHDRFNQLIEQRSASAGPPTDDAKSAMSAKQELPVGTKTWVAFRSGNQVIGVFLLEPRPPENATILEEIIEAP